MTLNQIHYFVTIARFENYHLAANALHISQPSLSRSMALLEEELKTSLFEKRGRGIGLTKAGHLFLERALEIEASCVKALKAMEDIVSGGGVIDLGYVFPLANAFIPKCLQHFLQDPKNKSVSFCLHQESTTQIIQALQQGKLDVGFGFYVPSIAYPIDILRRPIFSLKLVAVVPLEHPLAQEKTISLAKLCQYPMIGYNQTSFLYDFLQDLYAKHQVEPYFLAQGPDEHTLCSLVSQNLGVAVMLESEELQKMGTICTHPLEEAPSPFEVDMFWKESVELWPALARFIHFIERGWEASSFGSKSVYV